MINIINPQIPPPSIWEPDLDKLLDDALEDFDLHAREMANSPSTSPPPPSSSLVESPPEAPTSAPSTSSSPQYTLEQWPRYAHTSIIGYLDHRDTRALIVTCKRLDQLFNSLTEQEIKSLLCPHFYLSRSFADPSINNGISGCSFRSLYGRLTAAHSSVPRVGCYATIPVGDRACPLCLRLTSTGTKLIVGLSERHKRAINFYDLNNNQLLWTLENLVEFPSILVCTPDEKYALASSGDNIIVINLQNGQILQTLEGHTQRIAFITLSDDGKTAYTGSNEGSVKRWHFETGECLATYKFPVTIGHLQVTCIQHISQDGKTAILSSQNGNLLVFDLENGKILNTLQGHSAYDTFYTQLFIEISSDQTTAVSCQNHCNTVLVWDH